MGIAGLSDFDSLLVYAIGTALVGAGGLITWAVKGVFPRLIAGFEKRNDALISATEKTAEAVGQIPVAFKSFELALLGAETRLATRIEGSQDKVIEEITDKRLSDLTAAVTGKHAAVSAAAASRVQ
jgi:hypothetical protein